MKSLPLIIFSILSFFGIVSYTTVTTVNKKTQQPDPVVLFLKQPGINVVQFNSTWNKKNEYKWVPIKDVNYLHVDIEKSPYCRLKHDLQTLPTLVIYKNGKEVHRYEADLMMKLNLNQQVLQSKLK